MGTGSVLQQQDHLWPGWGETQRNHSNTGVYIWESGVCSVRFSAPDAEKIWSCAGWRVSEAGRCHRSHLLGETWREDGKSPSLRHVSENIAGQITSTRTGRWTEALKDIYKKGIQTFTWPVIYKHYMYSSLYSMWSFIRPFQTKEFSIEILRWLQQALPPVTQHLQPLYLDYKMKNEVMKPVILLHSHVTQFSQETYCSNTGYIHWNYTKNRSNMTVFSSKLFF